MADLLLTVDLSQGRRAGLEQALRQAIVDGRLTAGSPLPPSRRLAADLGCSRATVVAAYEQLAREGYVSSRQGARTLVADIAARPTSAASAPAGRVGRRYEHDFRPGAPDVSQFPRAAWSRSVRRVLSEADDGLFDYSDPAGHPRLRETLVGHLSRSRAVDVGPDDIRLYGGFFAAIGFVAEVLRSAGRTRLAVEDPALFVVRDLLIGFGLDVVAVPVDDHGIDVDRLADVGADAVLVTPAHQFPLGVTMSADRRTALVAWARGGDRWIIEDDYDGEFRYDRQPVGSLQGLAPDRVIYAGTASKTLAPSLRMAWLLVPPDLRSRFARVTGMRAGVSAIDQLALADFIDRGQFDRHLRRVRTLQQKRHRAVTEALAAEVDWLRPRSAVAAGLHLTAALDSAAGGRSAEQIEQRLVGGAEAAGIGLFGLGPHWHGPPSEHGIVLGYSRPPEHGFANSLDRLIEYFQKFGA